MKFLKCSVLFFLAFLAGCNEQEITVKSDIKVVVDGNSDEWQGHKTCCQNGTVSVAAAVSADKQWLYMLLGTQNKSLQMQIIEGGITAIIKNPAVRDTLAGIKFPVHHKSKPPSNNGPRPNRDFSTEQISEMNRSLIIYGPKKDQNYLMCMSQALENGFAAAISVVRGNMVLEMKLPLLARQNMHGIPFSTGDSILQVSLETSRPDRTDFAWKNSPPGGRSGGTHGGPPGLPESGFSGQSASGQSQRGMNPAMPEVMKLKCKLVFPDIS